jgi:hypothetical protein
MVTAAVQRQRQSAQPGRRIELAVARHRPGGGAGVEQQVPVLGHEPEQQPVGAAQQRPVEVVDAQLPAAQPVAQAGVGGVVEEAAAEQPDRLLYPAAQLVERPHPLLGGVRAPGLQPARRRADLRVPHREPGAVAGEV